MKLIDHGDWGEYRGWRLEKRFWRGKYAWCASPPYEIDPQSFQHIWLTIPGTRSATDEQRENWKGTFLAKPVHPDSIHWPIEVCIDRFEEARERMMAAAFSGADDGRRGVLVPRPS